MRNFVKICGTLASTVALCGLGSGAAFAGGNGAQTFTQTDKNVTESGPDFNPCTGEPGTLTQTYNDIFHITTNKTGSWATGTLTGSVLFVPDNPASPTYTGHFTAWFGDENNLHNDVEHSTFNVHVTGSDGSMITVHENIQMATNANGVVTVNFDHMTGSCP